MNNRLIYSVLIVFILVQSACTSVPDGVVSEKTMEKILYDSYLGESLSETELTTVYQVQAKDVYLKSVLKKYDVSKQQYDASLNWYMKHLDIYTRIFNKVLARLKKEEARLKLESGDSQGDYLATVTAGDSVELWQKSSGAYFSGLPVIGNVFTEIKTNETFVLGDSLVFKIDIRLLNHSEKQPAKMVLTLNYLNDSSATVVKYLTNSDFYSIKIQSDTTKRLNNIIAGIYQNDLSVVSVNNISLKRFHLKKNKKK